MVTPRISRRWKVALWIVGALALVVGALAIALALSTPPLPADLAAAAPRDLPAEWVAPGGSLGVAAPESEPSAGVGLPYVTSGTLALSANGKLFGEETYELRVAQEGTALRSSGRFWFKVVLATLQVTFEQTLEADSALRPILYAAQFDAPLGMGRAVRAAIDGELALVERAGKKEEVAIDPERAVTLGTFSTYALLPHLFALRQSGGEASFDVLVLGGPPSQGSQSQGSQSQGSQSQGSQSQGSQSRGSQSQGSPSRDTGDAAGVAAALPAMIVRDVGPAKLQAAGVVLDVERYAILSPAGASDLYARGAEFLALRAGDGKNVLWVYRADYFPDGVEIASESPAPQDL